MSHRGVRQPHIHKEVKHALPKGSSIPGTHFPTQPARSVYSRHAQARSPVEESETSILVQQCVQVKQGSDPESDIPWSIVSVDSTY